MLTTVIYENGACGLVSTDHLDELIASKKIKQFLRSDGWAIIGRDPLRMPAKGSLHCERRKLPVVSLRNVLDIIM